MCGTGGKHLLPPEHPEPGEARGRANGCPRSSRSPHGVAMTAVTTRSTTTVDSMNQNRQSGPSLGSPNTQLSRPTVDSAYCPVRRCAPATTTTAGAAMRRSDVAARGPGRGRRHQAEPRQVAADEDEQRVRRALEREDVGVGPDDEQDRRPPAGRRPSRRAGPQPRSRHRRSRPADAVEPGRAAASARSASAGRRAPRAGPPS